MSVERNERYDLFVIGGGINGAAVACDAVGRGLSVALAEERDFAEGTSSRSSKLIHGGLRYLETYDFRLVREALREREILMAKTPHLVWPVRLVLPHAPCLRPRWMIRLGLFLYDHRARRKRLAASEAIEFADHPAGAALKPEFRHGFAYSDCRGDDARLVIANLLGAQAHGARILLKPFREQDLLDAVRAAIEQDRIRRRSDATMAELNERFATLSSREREVMAFVVIGRLNKQIAAEQNLSEVTVKVRRGQAMRKMRADTLSDLRMADKLGVSPRSV